MIEIAQILKPQGIKGEVKALPLTNVLAVFNSLKNCFIDGKNMKIDHISLRNGYLYIKFNEIMTRNDAEKYRNKLLKIDKQILEEIKNEGEWLVDDLIGLVLYDDKGNLFGQIVEVMNYGASDIFVIEKDGRKVEVPYIDGVFFEQDGKLTVDSEKVKAFIGLGDWVWKNGGTITFRRFL